MAEMKQAERPLTGLDIIFARRSVRSYTGDRLDQTTVRTLLDAAVQAPTALRAEPWAFVVVQDSNALRRYSDMAKSIWAGELDRYPERAGAGPADARSRFIRDVRDPAFNVFYDAGTLVVICARPLGPFVVADCWLAAENLMLAACAMGLGSCCIGEAASALNLVEVKRELGIPPDVTAVAPIVLGVPREEPTPVSRKSPEILGWR